MEYKLWINGEWQDTQGGSLMSIEDPTTGKVIAEVVNASREDVDRAVQAAKRAFYDGRWSKKSPGKAGRQPVKRSAARPPNPSQVARRRSPSATRPPPKPSSCN